MLGSRYFNDDAKIEIGIDEAGRGSFWGPLMAGAVIIPPEDTWSDNFHKILHEVKDSKKLSAKKRERLADDIKSNITQYGIGAVTSQEIDEYGITWANQEAFKRAIQNIPNINIADVNTPISNYRLIIDGNMEISKWSGEQITTVDGDAEYLAIAAASILAKVAHDSWITEYCSKNKAETDNYDLLNCKGYGTKKHRDAIKVYGGHELHRQIFIRNYLPEDQRSKLVNKSKKDKCLIRF
jgi:ribonuclease HII